MPAQQTTFLFLTLRPRTKKKPDFEEGGNPRKAGYIPLGKIGAETQLMKDQKELANVSIYFYP